MTKETPMKETKCEHCNGKGYNTQLYGLHYSADFIGDKSYDVAPSVHKIPCKTCNGTGLSNKLPNKEEEKESLFHSDGCKINNSIGKGHTYLPGCENYREDKAESMTLNAPISPSDKTCNCRDLKNGDIIEMDENRRCKVCGWNWSFPEDKTWRGEICEIISEMLDNPDEYGIYPTTKCYNRLENLLTSATIKARELLKQKIENMVIYEDQSPSFIRQQILSFLEEPDK